MSETAQTLIRSALRSIGAIAVGETPTDAEEQDALEALQFMLRHWSDNNIRLYCITQDTISLSSSTYYTIGSGGTINTARPVSIKGGYITDANGFDYPIVVVDEAKYRSLSLKNLSGTAEYIWYNPTYPLGLLYFWPVGGGTVYLDSVKALTEPSVLTSDVEFPPGYDDAIRWNLAVRLAPEYGKEASPTVSALAISSLRDIETRNFAEQVNAAPLDIIKFSRRWNINEG